MGTQMRCLVDDDGIKGIRAFEVLEREKTEYISCILMSVCAKYLVIYGETLLSCKAS